MSIRITLAGATICALLALSACRPGEKKPPAEPTTAKSAPPKGITVANPGAGTITFTTGDLPPSGAGSGGSDGSGIVILVPTKGANNERAAYEIAYEAMVREWERKLRTYLAENPLPDRPNLARCGPEKKP